MSGSAEHLLQAAAELTPEDRLDVAVRLMDSLPDQPEVPSIEDEGFAAELRRRSGDYAGSMTWEELRGSARSGE